VEAFLDTLSPEQEDALCRALGIPTVSDMREQLADELGRQREART